MKSFLTDRGLAWYNQISGFLSIGHDIYRDCLSTYPYIGGGLFGLFVAIVLLNSIVRGIGSAISSMTKPQPNSPATPTDINQPNLDACLNINKRLKAASISHEAVNKKYYKKYPDRAKKLIDPNNANDRQLRVEWCQVAETLVGTDR